MTCCQVQLVAPCFRMQALQMRAGDAHVVGAAKAHMNLRGLILGSSGAQLNRVLSGLILG